MMMVEAEWQQKEGSRVAVWKKEEWLIGLHVEDKGESLKMKSKTCPSFIHQRHSKIERRSSSTLRCVDGFTRALVCVCYCYFITITTTGITRVLVSMLVLPMSMYGASILYQDFERNSKQRRPQQDLCMNKVVDEE